ncbi:MAG: FG-GAP-like repeat-containing protein [Chitinophagaceae bacterium]|nr:FG-GAP-like repeat-containing protein [Chitinophagaceae bacterium]
MKIKPLVLFTSLFLLLLVCSSTEAQFVTVPNAFMPIDSTSKIPVYNTFADIDNDGYLDFLSLYREGGSPTLEIYKNNTGTSFTKYPISFSIDATVNGSSIFAIGDADNDGDIDIALGTSLFTNNDSLDATGTPTFRRTIITNNSESLYSLVDFNNDGLLDIFSSVARGSIENSLYRNDGTGFSLLQQRVFGLVGSATEGPLFADFDNDGDKDGFYYGNQSNSVASTYAGSRYYENNGGVFNEIWYNDSIYILSAEIMDGDKDGYIDIAALGHNRGSGDILFYLPNRERTTGIFQRVSSVLSALEGSDTRLSAGDYNNDATTDILINNRVDIFTHTGTGFFSRLSTYTSSEHGVNIFGDVDNDGDLDIVSRTSTRIILSRNEGTVPNTLPSAPLNIHYSGSGGISTFSWQSATDRETPQKGLSYTLYFGSKEHKNILRASHSFTEGPHKGRRKIAERGDIQGNSYWMRHFPVSGSGIYYWGVQAVDEAWAGGPFAEDSVLFVIPTILRQTHNGFVLKWQQIPNMPGIEYRIDISREKDFSSFAPGYKQRVLSLNTDSLVITELNPDTYYCRIVSHLNKRTFISPSVSVSLPLYTEISSSAFTFTPQLNAVSDFADYNNDGYLDLFVASTAGINLYTNNGGTAFTRSSQTFNNSVYNNASLSIGDIDGNTFVDIIAGSFTSSATNPTTLYKNTNGTFSHTNSGINGVTGTASSINDYDNDGDMDVFIAGGISGASSTLFKNSNNTGFTSCNPQCHSISFADAHVDFDFDNDGDIDIVTNNASGNNGSQQEVYVFNNTGMARFRGQDNTAEQVEKLYRGKFIAADYNNDGRRDLLYAGGYLGYDTYRAVSFLERNDGIVPLTRVTSPIPRLTYPTLNFADYDGDGDFDIFISGYTRYFSSLGSVVCSLYKNSNGEFIPAEEVISNYPVSDGGSSFADYDNDGDLDFFIIGGTMLNGSDVFTTPIAKLYRNESLDKNSRPGVPRNLQSSVSAGNRVTLVWESSRDEETAEKTLNYNLYVGTTRGRDNIRSSHAFIGGANDGIRKIVGQGTIQGNIYWLSGLANGKYYWSVQAIDAGFSGSPWGAQDSFVISSTIRTADTITFSALPQKTLGDAPFTISTTSKSSLPIQYISTNTQIATVNENTIHIHAAGTTSIIALSTGNNTYYAAIPVSRDLRVSKNPQQLRFFRQIERKTVVDPYFVLNHASASSNLKVLYSSSMPSIVDIYEDTIGVIYKTGTVVITAYNKGNANYTSAKDTFVLEVTKKDQSIRFVNIPADRTYGDRAFILVATSHSALPISFSSSSSAIIRILQNTATINGAGTTNITAYNLGDDFYFEASVSQIITIQKGTQTITFLQLSDKTYGNAPFLLTASSSSSLPISYSSSNTIIVLSRNTVNIVWAGPTSITAYQTGNENYLPAESKTISLRIFPTSSISINKQSQHIVFLEIPHKSIGDAPFILTATSQSYLEILFSTSSNVVSLSKNTVTIVSTGAVEITAYNTGDEFYDAESIRRQFIIIDPNKKTQSITFPDVPTLSINSTYTLLATASSSLPVSYMANSNLLTITGNTITTMRVGTVTVTAFQNGNAEYNPANSQEKIITITEFGDPLTLIKTYNSSIKLYPNPAKDYITIKSNVKIEAYKIYDKSGKILLLSKRIIPPLEWKIDIKHLSKGEYIVIMYGEGGRILKTEKIIKER